MNQQNLTIEERIAARTDLAVAGGTQISSQVGGLSFADMGQVMEFSKLMAVAGQAVPKHLRGQPGACLAVSLQALNWRMDPFAVANKSYSVNDRIAYEAQLIHAVIEQRAPIKGRIKGKVEGEGAKRKWRLWCDTTDGDRIEYEGPEIGTITTKNSPLWKADPDQQLWYYSVRAMCRRHFPDVILGVYEKEEIETSVGMRDVTPQETRPNPMAALAAKAREEAPQATDQAAEGQAEDQASEGHWTDTISTDDGAPGSAAWDEGIVAAHGGQPRTACPYPADPALAGDWLAAYDCARKAGEE
jgi:hypothetical protein